MREAGAAGEPVRDELSVTGQRGVPAEGEGGVVGEFKHAAGQRQGAGAEGGGEVGRAERAGVEQGATGVSIVGGDGERAGAALGEAAGGDPEDADERVILGRMVEDRREGLDVSGVDLDHQRAGTGRAVVEERFVERLEVRGAAVGEQLPVACRGRVPLAVSAPGPDRLVAGDGERDHAVGGVVVPGGRLPSGHVVGDLVEVIATGAAKRAVVDDVIGRAVDPARGVAGGQGDGVRAGIIDKGRDHERRRGVAARQGEVQGRAAREGERADGQGRAADAVVIGDDSAGARADIDRIDRAGAGQGALGEGDGHGEGGAAALDELGAGAVERDSAGRIDGTSSA